MIMNRLMRAEWYRVKKTYHLFWWAIALCIAIPYIAYVDMGLNNTGTGMNLFNMSVETSMMLVMYLPLLVGGMYVTAYENKVLCYEMMAGNSTNKIIFSKLLTVVPVMAVLESCVLLSPVIFYGVKNGYGDTSYLAAKIVLIVVICIRSISCAIMIMNTFRSAVGMFVIFLRYIVAEGVGFILVALLANVNKSLINIMFCLIQGAIECAGATEMATKTFAICIISSVVEMIFWYVLSYNSYRKRWFS